MDSSTNYILKEKEALINRLKKKGVLNDSNKRKFCWKEYWDDDIEKCFNLYKVKYRTEDEAWFCLLNGVEPHHCEICGELAKFNGTKKTKFIGYNLTCDKCSSNCVQSKLEKYHETIGKRTPDDVKDIFEKRKQTNLEKYGDENYTLFGSESFKENLYKKYGYRYNTQIPEVMDKIKQTNLSKYGVTCNLSLNIKETTQQNWDTRYDEIINKIKETNIKNLGVPFVGQSEDVINEIIKSKKEHVKDIEEKYNCTQQRKLLIKYGQGWKSLDLEKIVIGGRKFISNDDIPLIEQYINTPHIDGTSKKEKDLLRYIKTIYSGNILENVTNVISNSNNRYYELDIYLPQLHIAFEFNGSYWHSDKFKDKYYHQRKTKICYQSGVQLVHIYEYEWDNNREQIEYQIRELLNGCDCSKYNWIPLNEFCNYELTDPNKVIFDIFTIYDEGKFINKNIKL